MTNEEEQALRAELAAAYALIEQLTTRLQELEGRLAKDSHNSSKPPSSDGLTRKPQSLRERRGKKPGGQQGHQGSHLPMSTTPDSIVAHAPQVCPVCQHDLIGVASQVQERRQVVELPVIRVQVVEHQRMRATCPCCQSQVMGRFPDEVRASVQYGSRLKAVALYLMQQQLLPYARTTQVLREVLGCAVSTGTLAQWQKDCAVQLQPVEQQIKTALHHSPVTHADETGLRVQGRRQWMHVLSTARLTHYAIHAKRGSQAPTDIGILPGYTGTCVHDGWVGYREFACSHALCNAHHLRELTFVHEQMQQAWAGDLKVVLREMYQAVQQAKQCGANQLAAEVRQSLITRYQQAIHQGYAANPPPATPEKRGRGRPKHSQAWNLLTRLSERQHEVLAFLDDFAVPFDNNQAERDVRMVKVQQKISGTFRQPTGAEAFCRIRGYLSTLHKQGIALLEALEATFLGHPTLPSFVAE